jgi:hypothetical protein
MRRQEFSRELKLQVIILVGECRVGRGATVVHLITLGHTPFC